MKSRMMKICGCIFFLAGLVGFARGAEKPWVGTFTAESVLATSSPDNNFSTLKSLYASAKRSIHISVYELDNPALGDALEGALSRGVALRVLLEGSPIPKIPETELFIVSRLVKKGGKVFFYNIEKGRNHRAFKYFHAKYSVVDGRYVAVGSANYGTHGHPVRGTSGNREWEVIIDDRKAAQMFEAAFEHDAGLKDEWTAFGENPRYSFNNPSYKPAVQVGGNGYDLNLKPVEARQVPTYTIFAPDNSLKGPLLKALHAAKQTIDVEQLNFETYWGDKPYNTDREDSPMMNEILGLSRAGRGVRVILNDDMIYHEPREGVLGESPLERFPVGLWSAFSSPFEYAAKITIKPPRDNKATFQFLNKIAKQEGLNLEVRLLDYKRCGLRVLHNKGMILDREVTLIGSLNWGESAIKFNREAAVLMKSPDIARYYSRAFEYDWKCSEQR